MEPAPLIDRIKALADEATEQYDALQERRTRIADERAAEVAAIKQRHAEAMAREVEQARAGHAAKLAEIDSELQTIRRLRTALVPHDPTSRKPPQPRSARASKPWKASEPLRRTVLAAVTEGHETVREIADAVPFSQASVKNGLDDLRELGLVRLAGTKKAGSADARLYRATPQGHEFLTGNETNGSVEVGSNA